MIKNKRLEIRLSEEMLDFLHKKTENESLFIRNLIREKMEQGLDEGDLLQDAEIRARTPYIYFASLVRTIDGDTMLLDVDLGFFTTVRSKIRLAGIDTPAVTTTAGKNATTFVEKELKDAYLVIETRKKEKYGRYLAYVYYYKGSKTFEDIIRHGKCLNEELLKNGLAKKYSG